MLGIKVFSPIAKQQTKLKRHGHKNPCVKTMFTLPASEKIPQRSRNQSLRTRRIKAFFILLTSV
jgi:hypothetical protein